MTDDPQYGLGAQPSPPDDRDFPVSQLYAAASMAAAVVLPSSYRTAPLPPIADQDGTPRCVAYSTAYEKGHQDRIDQGQFFNFDEARFFAEIGGTADGAFMRSALDRMLKYGYPVVYGPDEASHKIAAYYAVPLTVEDIKQAIYNFGGCLVIGQWWQSWFHPVNGVLPAPVTKISGHAVWLDGWNTTGFEIQNSWGIDWGIGGRATLPYKYLLASAPGFAWEAWKTTDVLDYAVKTVRCAGGKLYTGPGTNYEVKAILPATSKASISATWTKQAWAVTACGVRVTGSKWYRIVALNGLSAQARWGVPAVFTQTAWF